MSCFVDYLGHAIEYTDDLRSKVESTVANFCSSRL